MNWRVFTQSYTAIPLMLLAILAMMILPLPGWLLDALFTFLWAQTVSHPRPEATHSPPLQEE